MSKAVMVSIHPEWCYKIATGEKTAEIRKTSPKLNTPFKCYIYCTKAKNFFSHGGIQEALDDLYRLPSGEIKFGYSGELMCCGEPYTADNFLNGKVIGEFVCHKITHLGNVSTDNWNLLQGSIHESRKRLVTECACLTEEELHAYGGQEAWHISQLIIYDNPRTVTDFWKPDKCPYNQEDRCTYPYHCFRAGQTKRCGEPIEKAPQSWCYVEAATAPQNAPLI